MNKIKILSLLPALVLCSCGGKKNKYAGTYQFRLGKSDGNHMEVTATITDESDEKVEGYKVMTLAADIGDTMDPLKQLDELEEALEELIPLFSLIPEEIASELPDIDEIIELLPKFVTAFKEEVISMKEIPFFYKVTDYKHEKYGNRLELGTHAVADILSSIKSKHSDLAEIIDTVSEIIADTGLVREDLFVMPDTSKYALNAFINKKGLTFQVPVSKDDLSQQFLWYGFQNEILSPISLPENYMSRMPGVKGEDRFGTHPAREIKNNIITKDEVAEVNKEFAYEFSKSPFYTTNDPLDETEFGRFVLDTSGETSKLYLKSPTEYLTTAYTGYVGFSRQELVFKVESDGLCKVTHNGKSGLKEGFTDDNGTEFKFSDVVSEPFEFRDFNIVNVGLSKIEL